jgi:cytoskeletal protein RodZ
MRWHIVIARSTLATVLVLSLYCVAAQAQQKNPQQTGDAAQASQTQIPQPATKDDGAATEQKASEHKTAEPAKPMTPEQARQAQLMADTQRLYQLTQELKAEVAKSNKDTLSLSVIKKADEVEKLARSVKDRMRQQQ